ncbi:MAG: mitochondrial fission ELM1 family protein [Synergistaceae bacterium]|nr:mitochondrial fission ELM1 family protein [Synergistaceae bacterium]
MPKFRRTVIISDGIRGHYHQSLGVAEWMERLSGTSLDPSTVTIPHMSIFDRVLKLKLFVRGLEVHGGSFSREWLKSFGVRYNRYEEGTTLFISAGSKAAPFCLALAKATHNKCAVLMTPSVLGTKSFNYAIVPKHDKPDLKSGNVITTLGAPNHIYAPSLKDIASHYFAGKDLEGHKVVAILIGGSDANYRINSRWAKDILTQLRDIRDAKFLITTSRRTGEGVEETVEEIFAGNPNLEYMFLYSRTPNQNSITAILGAATHVLVTEDSVSMVSEAVTAGFKVGLIRLPRTTGQIKHMLGYGARRFDDMFAEFAQRGLIEDFGTDFYFPRFFEAYEQKHGQDFNEAKRAADWILHHS